MLKAGRNTRPRRAEAKRIIVNKKRTLSKYWRISRSRALLALIVYVPFRVSHLRVRRPLFVQPDALTLSARGRLQRDRTRCLRILCSRINIYANDNAETCDISTWKSQVIQRVVLSACELSFINSIEAMCRSCYFSRLWDR